MQDIKSGGVLKKAQRLLQRRVSVQLLVLVALLLLLPYVPRCYNATVMKGLRNDSRNALGIKELIRQVKRELYETELEGLKNRELALFQVKTFDLEINFVVRAEAEAGAQLVAVTGGVKTGSEQVQKITLHMVAIEQPEETHTTAPSKIATTPDVTVQ